MRVRHFSAPRPLVEQRLGIERSLAPSARDLFPALVLRLEHSRPVIGERVVIPKGATPDRKGVIRTTTEPIYGAPTFRNVIDRATGEHV